MATENDIEASNALANDEIDTTTKDNFEGEGNSNEEKIEPEEAAPSPSFGTKLCNFYNANSFLIGVVIAILLARAYPPLGAVYVYPQITATWIAVVFIFCKYERLNQCLCLH